MTDLADATLRARQMYADGATLLAIKAQTGLTHHGLYRAIDGGDGLPALPRRRIVRRARISAGDRVSLIARIMRSSERQVAEIEKRIGTGDDQGEQDARALAVISRTLRELTAIEAMNKALTTRPDPPDEDEDRPPDDIDEFRAELTRRIQSIISGGEDTGAAGGSAA